ncbi:MAG: FAD-binding protein [Flavobacteriales bacterium]|nr:FAD-binding protein [Flavobacteriales bacterium]
MSIEHSGINKWLRFFRLGNRKGPYTRVIWKNAIKNQQAEPLLYFEPESREELVEVVNRACQKGLRVRVVGSGHSFSEAAVCNDYLINMFRLNRPLEIKPSAWLDHWNNKPLVNVEGGMSIKEFNAYLDTLDYAIVNMGGVNHQSLAGALSTGTHGSGRRLPAISGMVRSMLIIGEDGQQFRIESADNPLSKPVGFDEPGVTLIQDNDVFNSVLVNLGTMGIIYSMVMEVLPMYWLKEQRFKRSWKEVKEQLLDGRLFINPETGQEYRSIMVRINPYEVEAGKDHTCLLIVNDIIEKPTSLNFRQRTRKVILQLVDAIKIMPRIFKLLMHWFPSSIPKFVERSLRSEYDKEYVNRAHKVLYLGLVNLKEHGYESEFAFPEHKKEYLDAVEQLFGIAKNISESSAIYQTSQIGLRFVAGSSAFLTPESGYDVCYIDVPFAYKTRGAQSILEKYQDAMLERGARPHWGKMNNRLTPERAVELLKSYPGFPVWKRVHDRFNPKGTFTGPFAERLGILPPAQK